MILDELKSGTAAAHASLESRLLVARPAPTLSIYGAYLRAMFGFIAPLEEGFGRLPSELADTLELSRRGKARLISIDLETLAPRLGLGVLPLPWCDALPDQGSTARVLGSLYVMEGSTLGARWLLRHLAPLQIDDSCAYLQSYGEDVGPMWQRMRAALLAYSQRNPPLDAELVAAARETFQRLDAWFVRCGAAEVSRPS